MRCTLFPSCLGLLACFENCVWTSRTLLFVPCKRF